MPPPHGVIDGPFHLLVSTLDYSPYLGRMAIGRIEHGELRVGDPVAAWQLNADSPGETVKVPSLFSFESLGRTEIQHAVAGEIVAVAGIEGAEIGATLCDPGSPMRLEGIAVEPPTLSVEMRANTSPFSGRAGKYVTSRQIRDRLYLEAHSNVALRVEETELPDRLRVSGRGELHLAILMETMRREGYEFSVSRPHVITRPAEDGRIEEPYEEVVADVPQAMVGVVMQGLGERKGEMTDMEKGDGGLARLHFLVPSRALTGYRSEFLTETRGEGTLHRQFDRYGPWAGDIEGRKNGAPGVNGRGDGEWVFAVQLAGAWDAVRQTDRRSIRRHGRGRARARERPRGQRYEGKETDQRQGFRIGRPHRARARPGSDPRVRSRVHRRGRIAGGDTRRDPDSKALPQHPREETGSKGNRGRAGCRKNRLSGPAGRSDLTRVRTALLKSADRAR